MGIIGVMKQKRNRRATDAVLGTKQSEETLYTYYICSINKRRKDLPVYKKELDDVIIHLMERGLDMQEPNYENSGKYYQLHCHFIVRIPLKRRYSITRFNGFQIHYSKVYDYTGAYGYVHKENDIQHQVFDLNYYYNNYGFVD